MPPHLMRNLPRNRHPQINKMAIPNSQEILTLKISIYLGVKNFRLLKILGRLILMICLSIKILVLKIGQNIGSKRRKDEE
jgi:hypothetical protein